MQEYGCFIDGFLEVKKIEARKYLVQEEDGQYTTHILSEEEQIAELPNGWKPIDPLDAKQLECDDPYSTIRIIPFDAGDHIAYRYEKVKDHKRIQYAIEQLKKELSETDYMVIKCYEASLLDEEPPYSVKELHARREEQRRKINELEALLATCIIKHVEFD